MTSPFSVPTDPHFERLARTLRKRHPDFDNQFASALEIVKTDPYNRTRGHPIKKLHGVDRAAGQYRLRTGRWRFRYDIYGAGGCADLLRLTARRYLPLTMHVPTLSSIVASPTPAHPERNWPESSFDVYPDDILQML